MNYKILTAAGAALFAVSAAYADSFKVVVPLTEDEEGAMAYLTDYDSGDNIDSVIVADNQAVFIGNLDKAVAARISLDGKRSGLFFVEPNTEVVFDVKSNAAKGGALNAASTELNAKAGELAKAYQSAADDNARMSIYAKYQALNDSVMNANLDNALGLSLFLNSAYQMEPADFDAFLAQNPSFKASKRVQSIIKNNEALKATQVGAMFVDTEVKHQGVTHKLSDLVGKGQPVLVDFWASWCGPCRREIPHIKEIYNAYKDKGLKVLGMAVWDKPEDTKRAVDELEIPWEVWYNGQRENTDAYGILGIPTLILFDGEGKIVSRGLQGDELRAAVDAYMSTVKAD